MQRAALLLGGPDIRWSPGEGDDNPSRFYEPLLSGPHKGKTANREDVKKMKTEYYRAAGWNEKGVPRSDVLKKLGLQQIDRILREKLARS